MPFEVKQSTRYKKTSLETKQKTAEILYNINSPTWMRWMLHNFLIEKDKTEDNKIVVL